MHRVITILLRGRSAGIRDRGAATRFNKLGTFRDTLSDRAGCDSIIVYKVDYGYQHDTSFVYRTCADNPIQVINGEWINKHKIRSEWKSGDEPYYPVNDEKKRKLLYST